MVEPGDQEIDASVLQRAFDARRQRAEAQKGDGGLPVAPEELPVLGHPLVVEAFEEVRRRHVLDATVPGEDGRRPQQGSPGDVLDARSSEEDTSELQSLMRISYD